MAPDDALRDPRLGAKEGLTAFRLQPAGGWPVPIVRSGRALMDDARQNWRST
jgi:hypothetical protein